MAAIKKLWQLQLGKRWMKNIESPPTSLNICYHRHGAESRPAICVKCDHWLSSFSKYFLSFFIGRKYDFSVYLYSEFKVLKCRFTQTGNALDYCISCSPASGRMLQYSNQHPFLDVLTHNPHRLMTAATENSFKWEARICCDPVFIIYTLIYGLYTDCNCILKCKNTFKNS